MPGSVLGSQKMLPTYSSVQWEFREFRVRVQPGWVLCDPEAFLARPPPSS